MFVAWLTEIEAPTPTFFANSTFDVAFKEFTTFKGATDKSGHVKFEITLPDYFVGHPLASGNAIVKLDAKVTDTALTPFLGTSSRLEKPNLSPGASERPDVPSV